MGQHTLIQWCDSTVNSTTGCDGCELWPGPCYAGPLHEGRLAKAFPALYAPSFTEVRLAPGRAAKAASWPDLRGKPRPGKPWLDGLPRLIFVGDMGDVFSKAVPFDYLRDEMIAPATSPKGRRHVWMVLTKRPARVVEFATWLREEHGQTWPENLWTGTSITSERTASRAEILAYHPAPVKFLSVEPMRGPVDFAVNLLRNFALVIFGGESRQDGHEPYPCDVGWIRAGVAQARAAGACPFVKQLGSLSVDYRDDRDLMRCHHCGHVDDDDGFDIIGADPGNVFCTQCNAEIPAGYNLADSHGGDWSEWPDDLRIREFPATPAHVGETARA